MSVLCACGKVSYDSPQEASKAIRSMQKRKRRTGIKPLVDKYKCEASGKWHVTSTPRISKKNPP